MKCIVLAIVVAACVLPLTARRTNTQPSRRLQVRPEMADGVAHSRHLAAPKGEFEVTGYDKPLRSRHETMLVTNCGSLDADSLYLSIDYTDLQGRQLHRRALWVAGDVPPGETRQISFPSWDVQCSYVYRHSPQPRRLHTPYDVTVSVDSISVSR